MDKDEIIREVNKLEWWHGIDLGQGIVTPGAKGGRPDWCQREARQWKLTEVSFAGKTVLDVGAWDGFFSFFAEQRGARRVVAVETFERPTFRLAQRVLKSKVELVTANVYDLSPAPLGLKAKERFDVTLFPGVLYHLKNPFLGLERVAEVTGDLLIVETTVAKEKISQAPRMYLIGQGKRPLERDPSNWWNPNVSCLKELLRLLGFTEAKGFFTDRGRGHRRYVIHARRTGEKRFGPDSIGHDVKFG